MFLLRLLFCRTIKFYFNLTKLYSPLTKNSIKNFQKTKRRIYLKMEILKKKKDEKDSTVSFLGGGMNEINNKTRMKDYENQVNLVRVNEEERKANETRHTIVKIKDKNKAPFSMFIDSNISYLSFKKNYLSSSEKSFLLDISPCLQLNSNILIDVVYDEKRGEYQQTNSFIDIMTLSKVLNMSDRQLRTIIKSLIDKGILFELLTNEHIEQIKTLGHISSERILIVNPEILFKGDKNKIEVGLSTMTLNFDKLEKNNIKLPWKIWIDINAQHGKLYKRDTYLKKKNHREEQKNNKSSKTGKTLGKK
jgi:hypothetical protein